MASIWNLVPIRIIFRLLLRRCQDAAESDVRHARVRAASVTRGGAVARAIVVVAQERPPAPDAHPRRGAGGVLGPLGAARVDDHGAAGARSELVYGETTETTTGRRFAIGSSSGLR